MPKPPAYPNFIVFSRIGIDTLPKDFNTNIKFTLFRYGGKLKSQHCNICGITKRKHVSICIKLLAQLIQVKKSKLSLTIDNLCATTSLPTKINKLLFIKANPTAFQQFERFPAIFLRSRTKVVLLIYASGAVVFSGAKETKQISEASKYLEK